jgi:hypothetical protein
LGDSLTGIEQGDCQVGGNLDQFPKGACRAFNDLMPNQMQAIVLECPLMIAGRDVRMKGLSREIEHVCAKSVQS